MENRLVEWRLRTRHTQGEIAAFLGVSITTITRQEHGSRGLTHKAIVAYAALYKIPTYALFFKPGNPLPKDNRLRKFREAAKLTLAEVAKLTDIEEWQIVDMEEGIRPVNHDELIALCQVYKVSTYRIVYEPPRFVSRLDGALAEDTYADENPVALVGVSGDPGTPYATFDGGWESRHAAATGA